MDRFRLHSRETATARIPKPIDEGTGCSQPLSATLHDCFRDEGVGVARKRREYSMVERRELWDRWRRGESYADIARALDRVPATIYCTIRRQGGVAPRERRRSRLALTFAEREEISRGIAAGRSARRIAAGLGRAPSTVTREIDRHGGRSSYRAAVKAGLKVTPFRRLKSHPLRVAGGAPLLSRVGVGVRGPCRVGGSCRPSARGSRRGGRAGRSSLRRRRRRRRSLPRPRRPCSR